MKPGRLFSGQPAGHSVQSVQRSGGNRSLPEAGGHVGEQSEEQGANSVEAGRQLPDTPYHFGDIPTLPQKLPTTPSLQTKLSGSSAATGTLPLSTTQTTTQKGLSPPLSHSLKRVSALPVRQNALLSAADNPFERQADEVADRVLQMSELPPVGTAPPAIQRQCAECAGEEDEEKERQDEVIQAKPLALQGGGGGPDTAAAVQATRLGGMPMSDSLRSFFEPRFGHDFSRVRIHTGSQAAAAAKGIGARAYAVGSDIVFGAGEYAPATAEGRRLLAHELTHTIQQGAADVVRRAPSQSNPEDDYITRKVTVVKGLTGSQQFLRYAETIIFGRVVNIDWQATTPGAASLLSDPARHVGESLTFRFRTSLFVRYGGETASAQDRAEADSAYKGLDPTLRSTVDKEIDRRYYQSTGEIPGTLIKKGEKGKIDIWNSFQRQVLADKRKLDALPDAIKTFLGGPANFTPAQYEILSRLADKLSQFSAADLEDYKSKVNATTSDLALLESSIDQYLRERAEREQAREERETIATKLFGAESLYEEYKRLGREPAELEKKARDQEVQGAGHIAGELRQKASQLRKKEIEDFTLKLQAFGFSGIPEFQQYLDNYEQAFLKEAVALTLDVLQQYEHKLWEAERQYSQGAVVDGLLAQVQGSEAPALIEQAKKKVAEAKELSGQGSFQTVQGAGHIGNKLSNQAGAKMNEAKSLTAQASSIVKGLPGHPLIADDKFPRAALLSNDRATAQGAILAYISDRRADIKTSRENLAHDPKIIYKLPNVLTAAFERQDVQPGTILQQLITDRKNGYLGDEALFGIVLAVVGVALTIITAGGGALGVAAGLGALGISGYQAIHEFKEYEQKSAFAGAGLADDPSLTWVIVAVVGAFADLGQAVSAVKAIKASNALTALEAAQDVTQFEKKLADIKELNQVARTRLVQAAEARRMAVQSLKNIVTPTGQLNAVLIPGLLEAGHLTVAAYYAVKSGVHTFSAWLSQLKGANIIADTAHLSPADLRALKTAWAEGQQYTKTVTQNIPELEQAIKEFRASTGIQRGISSEGKVQGGATAAAKTEVEGVTQSIFKEGSTKSKGASASAVKTNTRYKSPQSFGATKNHAEQNILGDIANEIDQGKNFSPSLRGTPKPEATGKIQLHIEQEVCAACRQGLANPAVLPGVVKQFSTEYPNITIVITNMRTPEVLFVRGGKVIVM